MSDDIHLAEDARKYRRRLKRQRVYTKEWREGLKRQRIPERDHVAAACFRIVARGAKRNPGFWDPFLESLVREVCRAHPEFEPVRTRTRILEMVDRDAARDAREREVRNAGRYE